MGDIYISIKNYAKMHGKTEKTIYNWIESGKINKKDVRTIMGVTFVKKW